MQLIKVEIKEEVIDIHEVTEYSCEDSLQTKDEEDSINNFGYLNISHAEEVILLMFYKAGYIFMQHRVGNILFECYDLPVTSVCSQYTSAVSC